MPPHTHKIINPGSHTHSGGSGDMTKAVYDLAGKNAQLAALTDLAVDANLSAAVQDAVTKKHDGAAQDTVIAGKTTLTAVKADIDVASAISLKHSNSSDHNGGTQDAAIAGKEPANANIQTHVTSAHAPSNAQKNSDITKAEIEAKLTGEISSHTHAGGGGESEVIVVKIGDTSNATTTYADATGLSFTSVGGKTYIIEAWIRWATSALTVGIKLSVNGPTTPGFVADVWNAALTTSLISGGGGNAYKVGGASASAFATADNLAMLNILYRAPAGGGVVTIQFAAETTGTVTIKDGSVLRYRQVD